MLQVDIIMFVPCQQWVGWSNRSVCFSVAKRKERGYIMLGPKLLSSHGHWVAVFKVEQLETSLNSKKGQKAFKFKWFKIIFASLPLHSCMELWGHRIQPVGSNALISVLNICLSSPPKNLIPVWSYLRSLEKEDSIFYLWILPHDF